MLLAHSIRISVGFIIGYWKEPAWAELLEPLGKAWETSVTTSGGPRDGFEGGQKGLNDVEAKREPKQFRARERTVTKQNFRVIRLNSL